MTLSKGLGFPCLSLPTVGMGESQALFPRKPFPLPPTFLMDPLHSSFGCFGCKASVAAPSPTCVPSPALPGCPALSLALSASPSHHPHLCLFFPVGLSLSPPSSVSLDPRSSQTWFTFRWLQRYFAPSLLPPRPRGPDHVGSTSCPGPHLLFLLVGQLG